MQTLKTMRKTASDGLDSFFKKEQEKININVNTGLTSSHRKDMSNMLSEFLANTFLLFFKTMNYHWNIKGSLFRDFRLMTEEQSLELFNASNDISERIRSLGHPVPGSLGTWVEKSEINNENTDFSDKEMVADLIKNHELIAKTIRGYINEAREYRDEASIDLLRTRLKNHEKAAWMFRSLLER